MRQRELHQEAVMRRAVVCCAFVGLLCTSSVARAAPQALRVAIPDAEVDGDVESRLKLMLTQSLVAEVRKLEAVSAISADEVRELLAAERQRQLLGCSEDGGACLAELAGALGADELVATRLAAVGKSYSLSVKRLDGRRFRVIETFTRTVERRDGEELLALVGPAIQALFPERPLRQGKTRGVAKEVARRLNPPPLPRWVFISTLGAAVLTTGVGSGMGYLAAESHRDYVSLTERARLVPVPYSEMNQARRITEERALAANVLFASAGALALGAVLQAVFTDWNDDRSLFGLGPAATGAGLAVSARF
jgi:hypothetical protein